MHEITIKAALRTRMGRHARSLRREGNVPGVYYLHGEENIAVAVDEKSLKALTHSLETHIINLALDNGLSRKCILRDVQFDPVTDRPVHFDVQGLKDDEQITIEVPIVLTGGTPAGVRDGGILQHFLHRLKISCLPKDIPEHIEVNPENLKINQFIHLGELKIDRVKVLGIESTAIVGVIPPVVEKEEVPAVEEAVEPEVIGKGGKTEEEGAAEEGEAKGAPAKAAAPAKGAAPAKAPEAKEEKKK